MKLMHRIVYSRIRYYKSRSILTLVTLILTTTLLVTIAFTGAGALKITQENASTFYGNHHAAFSGLTTEELTILAHHKDVEALSSREIVATVEKDKINAFLNYNENYFGSITSTALTAGRMPQSVNEIAGPPSFFERLGEEAAIGNTVPISFRLYGEGEILTENFTITGLMEQVDLSKLDVADTRIVYSAAVSKAFADNYLTGIEREYTASVRIFGEDVYRYDEMCAKIETVGSDIGLKDSAITLNKGYLIWTLEPGYETIIAVVGISALVVLFSALVIYSIYYVASIANIQELGKLKALGATKKQMRRIFWEEGFMLALAAMPIGVLLGWIIAFGVVNYMSALGGSEGIGLPRLWNWRIVFGVVGTVIITILISLQKPMRMAAKISPIEAIRYQEAGTAEQAQRKGYKKMTLSRLSCANLARNRKRTLVTIVTMGLSCVVFMAAAGLLNSIDVDDLARRQVPYGEFELSLYYSSSDETYPENNLNNLQLKNYLGKDLQEKIMAIDGVTAIRPYYSVLASIDDETFGDGDEKGRLVIGTFSRDEVEKLNQKVGKGTIDYDQMVNEKGVLYGYDIRFEENNFSLGKKLPITILDGDKERAEDFTLMASGNLGGDTLLMPKALFDQYVFQSEAVSKLYIFVQADKYAAVKKELQAITDSNVYFRLMSYDEEVSIAKSQIQMTKYPAYILLVIIGVISFMNLINTMITSIVTRKRELGILQAIGLSDHQLAKMLRKEGAVFTAGALCCALSVGNILGYLAFLWGKNNHFLGVQVYHYPLIETIVMVALIAVGQLAVTAFIGKYIHKESLIERIR